MEDNFWCFELVVASPGGGTIVLLPRNEVDSWLLAVEGDLWVASVAESVESVALTMVPVFHQGRNVSAVQDASHLDPPLLTAESVYELGSLVGIFESPGLVDQQVVHDSGGRVVLDFVDQDQVEVFQGSSQVSHRQGEFALLHQVLSNISSSMP